MNINSIIPKLLKSSDNLGAIRNTLVELLEGDSDSDEQCAIMLCALEVHVAYLTLLNEYELLDTSNIIQKSYLNLYYDRRLEMLQKSKKSLGHCHEGLEDFSESIMDELKLNIINRAQHVMQVSLQAIDECLSILRQHNMLEAKTHTMQ